MTRNRKLVLATITTLMLSVIVTPGAKTAAAWAIVQCAQMIERALPMKIISPHQLDPTCPQCL